jgi:hypothetical protein
MSDPKEQERKTRPPRVLPVERLVPTAEAAGILGEHKITCLNKANPEHITPVVRIELCCFAKVLWRRRSHTGRNPCSE